MNSAFKAHVSVQKTNQCKPLTIAKDKEYNIPYLPVKDQDSLVFYGTQKFYVFIRLFYTFYERVLKAYELCHVIEENEITKNLTKEERDQLCEERYHAFKLMLTYVIKN